MRLCALQAQRWLPIAERSLVSSRILFQQDEFRGSVNRAYYAVYQLATSFAVEHGDTFPSGWNNPTHDQLPGLILNNSLLEIYDRRIVSRSLRRLRAFREDADYRPGRTLGRAEARAALFEAEAVFKLLAVLEPTG